MSKKALIIGGGAAGSTAAIELSKKNGWETLLVEKGSSLGAGVWTNFMSGHPYTYGPRHFLSHNEEVFNYLNDIVPLRLCKEHQFTSFVEQDGNFYNYPIHEDDFDRMPDSEQVKKEVNNLDEKYKNKEFKLTVGEENLEEISSNYEDFWLKSVGPTLYEKFIKNYTKKMWQVDDNKVIDDFTWSPKGVAIKKGDRAGWDKALSAYPIALNGYNDFFNLASKSVKTLFNTSVDKINPDNNSALINGEWHEFDIIINTTPIDHLLDYCFGELKYIGRDITFLILPVEFALPPDVYFNYYCGSQKYSRVVEYKKFTKYKSPNTLISLEYPSDRGRLYPMPTKPEHDKAKKYFDLMPDNFHSIGRIGAFNYRYDIDDAIEQALAVTKNL
tara:strand:- start:765 stop:1922 length:1158 start_codon:yes stop_codon:yes gene_type:complete